MRTGWERKIWGETQRETGRERCREGEIERGSERERGETGEGRERGGERENLNSKALFCKDWC